MQQLQFASILSSPEFHSSASWHFRWTSESLREKKGWTWLHQDHLTFGQPGRQLLQDRRACAPLELFLQAISSSVLPLIKLPWIRLPINSQARRWQYYIWEFAWTSGKSSISQCCPWRITSHVSLCKMQIFQWQLSKKESGKEKT